MRPAGSRGWGRAPAARALLLAACLGAVAWPSARAAGDTAGDVAAGTAVGTAGATANEAASAAAPACDPAALENPSGRLVLDGRCRYARGLHILRSHVSVDCRGALLDGKADDPAAGDDKFGVLIEAVKAPIEDVEVRNCRLRGFARDGVRVRLRELPLDRDEAYRRAPRDVRLTGLTIEGSGNAGVYIDAYVTGTTLSDSTIRGSRSVAVYLNQSSQRNQLVNNRFVRNGYDAGGQPRREAVAVDSSADNEIRDNLFWQNGRGGVFLYKNCGEKASSGRSALRWQSSDRNRIVGNTFAQEGVGVWIASRQSMDLSRWDCGDTPMDGRGTYFEDHANQNLVQSNRFCATRTAVRIEGDDNRVLDNAYDAETRKGVDVPVSQRARLLNRPATGNVIDGERRIGRCELSPPP